MRKSSVRRRLGRMWAESRGRTEISQIYMAEQLDISPNTVANMEKGTSIPNILQAIDWFDVLGIEPFRYYLDFLYPEVFDGLDAGSGYQQINSALHKLISIQPRAVQAQLAEIVSGAIWMPFDVLMHYVTMYLKTPMMGRVMIAYHMEEMHDAAETHGTLEHLDRIGYSRSILDRAIERAKNTAMEKAQGYTNGILPEYQSPEHRAERQALMSVLWAESRKRAGASIEHMSLELGVSEKTVRNWENGQSMPNLLQELEWFDVLGVEPVSAFLEFKYRDEFGELKNVPGNADGVEKLLHQQIDDLPEITQRQFLNMMIGGHGTPLIPLIQYIIMCYELPQAGFCSFVRYTRTAYDMFAARGELVNLDHVGFSRETLDYWLERATNPARKMRPESGQESGV